MKRNPNRAGADNATRQAARCYQNVKWWQLYRRFYNWNLWRKIKRACDESRKRVSAMSKEERDQLTKDAHKFMFPDGYWTCYCILKGGHLVAKGEACFRSGEVEA